jgi:transposase-like protein
MPLRKVRDADDAIRCLNASTTSGEERASWARRHGIDPRSLNAWRLNLARTRRAQSPAVPRLVELVPAVPATEGPSRYRVVCGEMAVEVDERFDERVLRRLLAVVASC